MIFVNYPNKLWACDLYEKIQGLGTIKNSYFPIDHQSKSIKPKVLQAMTTLLALDAIEDFIVKRHRILKNNYTNSLEFKTKMSIITQNFGTRTNDLGLA